MASERAKADEENLRQTAFEKGEWANQPPTDLDVDYGKKYTRGEAKYPAEA